MTVAGTVRNYEVKKSQLFTAFLSASNLLSEDSYSFAFKIFILPAGLPCHSTISLARNP